MAGIVAGALVCGVPWWYWRQGGEGPPVNDITTDTADPPRFVALLPLRKGAPNPADYPGTRAAARQRTLYPDIAPVRLPASPSIAFEPCARAAQSLGWEIVAAVPAEGRIEAIDTTFFFGFKDDVAIRVTADGAASRVDVRSKSRVGRRDFGTNAKRIRAFFGRLTM